MLRLIRRLSGRAARSIPDRPENYRLMPPRSVRRATPTGSDRSSSGTVGEHSSSADPRRHRAILCRGRGFEARPAPNEYRLSAAPPRPSARRLSAGYSPHSWSKTRRLLCSRSRTHNRARRFPRSEQVNKRCPEAVCQRGFSWLLPRQCCSVRSPHSRNILLNLKVPKNLSGDAEVFFNAIHNVGHITKLLKILSAEMRDYCRDVAAP
jgi:hypothetical protein